MFLQFITKHEQSIQRIEQCLNQIDYERENGHFPSQAIANPKGE